jgi:hypothetical protein
MSAELVGPLPVIGFMDGSTQAYTVPRDTMDIRYAACRDHHPACDCREAHLAEDIHEYRTMYRELEQAVLAAISGHQTYAYTGPSDTGWQGKDVFGQCKCQACGIARAARIGGGQCASQYLEASRRLEFERREADREYYARNFPQTDEVPF